ncbi:MAG: hypothetical protein R2839_12680 [Thermomicrobiales bacterium]
MRLNTAEVVFPGDLFDDGTVAQPAWLPESIALSKSDAWHWRLDRAEERLCEHFGVESLDGFGCAGKPLAIRRPADCFTTSQTQRSGLKQILALTSFQR